MAKQRTPDETCTDCPERNNCAKPCEKIKGQLSPELRHPEFRRDPWEPLKEDQRGRLPDDLKNDPQFRHQEHETIGDRQAPSISKEDWEAQSHRIDKAFFNRKEHKRQFRSFVKCDSISRIARRAETSRQSIQKAFAGKIRQIGRDMTHSKRPVQTPGQFKKHFNLTEGG